MWEYAVSQIADVDGNAQREGACPSRPHPQEDSRFDG